MSINGTRLTRRDTLKFAATATAGLSMPWAAGAAFAQQGTTLRAGIAGFNVINTLDPMKASLIPEFSSVAAKVLDNRWAWPLSAILSGRSLTTRRADPGSDGCER